MSGTLESCVPCDCDFPIAPVGEPGPQGAPGPQGPRGPQGPSGGGGAIGGIENIASLKAMLPAELQDFDVLTTNGYYEAGDGGEGTYRYLSTATDTPDDGSIIEPDSGVGRFFLLTQGHFNVRQFGCKGDGTYHWFRHLAPFPAEPTDDFVQMQRAFDYATDSGDVCHISAGIYKISGTLLVRKGWATVIVGDNAFDYQGYLDFATKTDVAGWKTCMLVAGRLSTGPLLIVRGATNYIGGGTGPLDPELDSYTSGSGYRNAGTRLENFILAAQGGSVMTTPLVVMKRLARCYFQRLVFQNAPYQGLQAAALDDTLFDECYFYVCGIIGKTYACQLRRNFHIANETDYPFTNTLHFRNCDFEGNNYGNLEVTNAASGDTGAIISLFMIDCIGKSVQVFDSGRNGFSFYACTALQVIITAAMGGGFAPPGTTATEIVKMEACKLVIFDITFGLTAGLNLQLSRFMTLIDTYGVLGRAAFLVPIGSHIPSEEYYVNASVGVLGQQPKQIHIDGVIDNLSGGSTGKKVCNIIGIPQNAASDTLLGELIGADFNVTTDQAISIRAPIHDTSGLPFYKITQILVCNATVNMTTAAGGIYAGALKTGVTVVAAGQSYALLTSNIKNIDLTIADNDIRTANPIYFSLTTAQGVAATADIRIYGRPLAP